jgi:hypothetical protein
MIKAGNNLGIDMTEAVKDLKNQGAKLPRPFIEYGEGEPPKNP